MNSSYRMSAEWVAGSVELKDCSECLTPWLVQAAPADSRRSTRPQLLAGYRALEPQQNLRTGPQ
jgi:hypothetical protein